VEVAITVKFSTVFIVFILEHKEDDSDSDDEEVRGGAVNCIRYGVYKSVLRIRIRASLNPSVPDDMLTGILEIFKLLYSTLLHLPPLRFHCVEGWWDRTQDCCDFGIGIQTFSTFSIRRCIKTCV
jgi:hypothetical protein